MTSISSSSFAQITSPRDRLQSTLSSEISAGTISATDESALSGALDDIDASIQSERGSATGGGQRPSADEIKSKIDDLIAGEVDNGKLTAGQADELKDVFAKAFQHGPHGHHGGHGGPGGPGGVGGPGDADGAGGAGSFGSGLDSSGDDSTTSSASTTDPNQLLQDFIKLLADSQGKTGYNAAGDLQSKLSSLLVDYQT